MRLSTLLFLGMAGCAEPQPVAPATPAAPPPDEHWETVSDRKLVSGERCGVGPFEIELPARDDEWGRRVVFVIAGPRDVVIDTDVRGMSGPPIEAMRWQTGFSHLSRTDGDHSRCQIGAGDTVPSTTAPHPGATPAPAANPASPVKRWWSEAPSAALPKLEEFTGALPPAMVRQRTALAWLPKGDPWFYADDLNTVQWPNEQGKLRIRIRFWLEHPSDLEGVIFQVLDQRLTPDLPIATWLPRYQARVADADARRDAQRPPPPACPDCAQKELNARVERCRTNRYAEECKIFHARGGRMPPPPKPEAKPSPMGNGVEWIGGYWEWSEEIDDFVWIDGTYVVRGHVEPPVKATPNPNPNPGPNPSPSPNPTVTDSPPPAAVVETIEAPREVVVELPPAPHKEVIAAPPIQRGAVWVAGHWQLVGVAWVWNPGRWVQPPAGARFSAPAIRTRGNVRVYVPGRWIRVR